MSNNLGFASDVYLSKSNGEPAKNAEQVAGPQRLLIVNYTRKERK